MSFIFELYYKPPADSAKEAAVTSRVVSSGGRLDYREDADERSLSSVRLTYEFDDLENATKAADLLRREGEHVEGPMEYAA
jgi:hypothetical protein